jgi:LuxR family maltose regulon positive regulatory protein
MSSAHRKRSVQENGAPALIDRPRLIDKLKQAVNHRLTLISAPPGYGKSTLAAQFEPQPKLPVIRHTIDASQRDVPILHQRALSLLERHAPGIRNLPQIHENPPIELATHITEYLREYLAGPIIYIFDDVHHLAAASPAETWLRTFVMQLPPQCHIVIISRVLPDLPLTELIARREVLAIGQEELRFRRDEIYALATRMRGVPPSQMEVEDLEVRLEGWPAGTVLALQPLPEDLERVMLRGGTGPEALFSDLARSMLQAQPPDLRNFLLASSTLARLTPELCIRGLELTDTPAMLVEALNRNLFLSRVTGGFAYHSLFRDFLQQQLAIDNPRLFRRLHARAAEWYEHEDYIIEAVDHYLIADQTHRAIVLVERVAESFFAQGKIETLLSWADGLWRSKNETPRLLFTTAKIHADRYEYDLAQSELHTAEKAFSRQNNSIGLAEIKIRRAMIHLQKGDYALAAEQAERFLKATPGIAHLRGRALLILGTALLNMGNVSDAMGYLEEALPLYRADGDAYALSSVLQNLEVAYNSLGRLDDSAACLQEVVDLRRKLGNTGALALALNNLGVHYYQYSDYNSALATFQEGLNVVARVPNQRAESYLSWSMGDLQRDRGAYSEARRLYYKALEITANGEPLLTTSLLISISTLERWQGNLREAISRAKEAAVLAHKHNLGLLKVQAQAATWSARIYSEPAQAHKALENIAGELRANGFRIELLPVLAYCIHATLLTSNKKALQDHFDEALAIAEELGTAQPLAAEMLHIPVLEELAKTRQSRYKLLTEARKRLQEVYYQPPVPIQIPTIATINQDTLRLRVLTLGQDTVERDGIRLTTSDWRASAARELFYYLMFCGPVSREDINLEFWPDSSTSRSRSRFHTTLYRARHALGENFIIFQDDYYQLNPETEVWCDAQEVEALTTQARLLSPRDARAADLWRKAVDLYKGEFLLSVDRDWVIERRELLHEAYIEALIGVGECARARGDFRAALNAFKQALDKEPYREDINRAIMISYADLGEKHQIAMHMDKFRELLRQDLAVEPSPETIELANRLLA